MNRTPPVSSFGIKGTVTLVALCFVTVLGITLAGYIAVCSRSMQLSNRTYQARTSQQLAEMGIDEALRAFNKNDFNTWTNSGITVTWDTATYAASKRAVATISYPAGKFGQGVTGSVKIRVDNFDANQLGFAYSASATYRINDLVGNNGIWYRSVQNGNTNNATLVSGYPNLAYWVPAPIPWTWISNKSYAQYEVVCYGGTWYTSNINANTSTPGVANWTAMPVAPSLALFASTFYKAGAITYGSTAASWLVNNLDHTSGTTWLPTEVTKWTASTTFDWAYSNATAYAFNDLVFYSAAGAGTWYRCIAASSTGNAPTNTTYWENALTGTMYGWNSSTKNYNIGDVVYYGTTSQWYRCIRAHTTSGSLTPSNTAYWANTPLYSTAWDSNKQYSLNDTVRYNGVWYRYINGSATSGNAPTNTTYWIGTNTATTSYQWNATTAYSVGDYRCYGGAWYKCTTAHTGRTPNETAYWTPTWANSFGVTTGTPVVYAEGTVAIANNPSVRTQLRATIAPTPLFPNAAAASTSLTVSGAGTVDSYDSTVGAYSAGTAGYSAVLAAGNTASTAVTLTGAVTVSGYVAAPSATTPSPYAPLFTYGTSVIVKGTSATPSPKVDVSRVSRSPSIPQFDTLPSGGLTAAFSAASIAGGLVLPGTLPSPLNLGTPGATAPSSYYTSGTLTLINPSPTVLNINGPVILYINGDLYLDGDGTTDGIININSAGSAEIHVAGRLRVAQNSDGIRNLTLDPKKLIIICDTAASTTQFYGDGAYPFYGVIYMPNTTNSVGLNFNNTISPSSANYALYGAVSAKKITYDNDSNLHYDTSLRYATFGGVDQPYTVTDWRELSSDEAATMP